MGVNNGSSAKTEESSDSQVQISAHSPFGGHIYAAPHCARWMFSSSSCDLLVSVFFRSRSPSSYTELFYVAFRLLKHLGPREKMSLGESLAGSHAYNPIRDFRRDSWRDFFARKVSSTVSPRDFWQDCWREFSRQKVSPRVSPRLVFFLLEGLHDTLFVAALDIYS